MIQRYRSYSRGHCLDTVELIMEFEKEFEVAIPDEQAESITTVEEAIKYLEENISQ